MKLAQNQGAYPPPTNSNDNLYQLLQLVQSLGGVDKVRALLAAGDRQPPTLHHLSDDSPRSRIYNEVTTQPAPSVFNPSYVTPSRNRPERDDGLSGERPSGLLRESSNLPRNQVRPRRPQYDNSETTPSPDHDIRDGSRRTGDFSSARTQSPFSFIYSNPTDRNNAANAGALHRHQFDVRRDNRSVDGFFVYNTPGRLGNHPSTRSASLYATESPDEISREIDNPDDLRIPVRVSAGNAVRFPSTSNSGEWEVSERRPTRVRINSAFEVDDRSSPYVDPVQPIQPFFVSHDPLALTTRKPIRRRPPQRAHLLNNNNNNNYGPIVSAPESSVSYDDDRPNGNIHAAPQPITARPISAPKLQPIAHSGEDLIHEYPYLDFANVALTTPRAIPFVPTTTARPTQRQRSRRPQAQLPREVPVQTTSRPRVVPSSEAASPIDETGPPVVVDGAGNAKCGRRGVHPHPGTCGQFVVCAPASRTNKELRAFVHHCPAEQVFVQGVGRCRPGNKERCEVFT